MVAIIVGKSGTGKDTLRNELVEKMGFVPIVSSTTRAIRENEQDGVDYHFISKEEFEKKMENGSIFEYRAYSSSEGLVYYGSESTKFDSSKDYVKVLDIDGAFEYIKAYGRENCFVIQTEADDKIRFERAFSRAFSVSEPVPLAAKEKFHKEWETRLLSDNKQFAPERTENIVNFVVDNSGEIDETAEAVLEALNLYDYEMQDYREISERRSDYTFPLISIESASDKRANTIETIHPSYVESLESLEAF